jgi:hypothetical protein
MGTPKPHATPRKQMMNARTARSAIRHASFPTSAALEAGSSCEGHRRLLGEPQRAE